MDYDILVIGGGPAGLSAAVNAAARGASCAVISNDFRLNPLYRAKEVDNYPGLRGQSGGEILERMHEEAIAAGTVFLSGRVISLLPMEDSFMVTHGTAITQARRVILATGAGGGAVLPGEERFIGRGVSYCATCDGMLYRGRQAVVTGDAADLAEEAAFLQEIGVGVTVITRRPVAGLPEAIPSLTARTLAVQGQDKLEGLVADDTLFTCDVLFILREVMGPDTLLPGLEMDGRFVRVNRAMETNIPGLYAAGDCTGKPLQIANAVGEGLIAAQNAARSLRT